MNSTRLKIKNSSGHLLHAHLELPANQKPNYYAIFAHCFTCSGNLNAVKFISRALTGHGFGVLRFDFTGLGKSEGEFAESHFSANVTDLLDVHDYMKENHGTPELYVGHSLGGAAVLTAAAKQSDVRAIATIGAPAHVDHVKHHFIHQVDALSENEKTEVNIGGRPFAINKSFVEGFEKENLLETVSNLKKPLLILHAPFDKIVGINNAQEIYHHAKHPKSFISLDSADHLLIEKPDAVYVGDVIGTWVNRYFPKKESKMLDPDGEQLVAHLDLVDDNFTTSIQTENHFLIADEPASVGGDDFGMSPYELLNAGLAACTTMTLKMYAARKKWDLREVYVYTSHSKVHYDDVENPEDKKKSIDKITKKLRFIGDLSGEQKQRLLEISSKCPVHRTLAGEVVFYSALLAD